MKRRHAMSLLAAAFGCAVAPSAAIAWGSAGHSTAAEIAEGYLGPITRQRIADLVGHSSLASISSWADTYAVTNPKSRPWHYVNVPLDAPAYDATRDCPSSAFGDCIVGAIAHFRGVLADTRAPRDERITALKMIVHLVVDLHQPLHCADRNDAGGSKLTVQFFAGPMSLHNVWDFGILDRFSYDWGLHVEKARAAIGDADVRVFRNGTIEDWAMEAHALAKSAAYDLPPDNVLADDYQQRALPIIHRQLAIAGVRLAWVLRSALVDGH
ncbi:MAG: S1/P1 nuclease [Hyphomicrobium sp.]|nr:S1/P1 nuclease [Hyphomicrobium sp.]